MEEKLVGAFRWASLAVCALVALDGSLAIWPASRSFRLLVAGSLALFATGFWINTRSISRARSPRSRQVQALILAGIADAVHRSVHSRNELE